MINEVYRPVWSLDIPGRTLEDVQGEVVTPRTAPFRSGHIPYFSVVSIGEIKSLEDGTETIDSKLVQITPEHGRSFELRFGTTPSIFWADEYGNVFSTLTTKGNYLANPQVVKSSQEPSGFAVFGMQDTDALVRILRVSKLLRESHIDTECYVKVIEPQELPYQRKLVPLEQFKDNLVKQIEEQNNHEGRQRRMNFGSTVVKADIPTYSEHLDNSTFVITVRGMQVAERLQDLDKPNNKEEFTEMMKRIFRYVNIAESSRAKKAGKEWSDLDPEKEDDITKYFQEYLPVRIATNYAGLHNLGLLHVYSHQGNISAVGSIYDLDSVKGEATRCNDEKVEREEFKKELDRVFEETKSTIARLARKGFIKVEGEPEPYKTFEGNFYLTYFDARTDLLNQLKDIAEYHEYFGYATNAEKLERFVAGLVERLGWDYRHKETIDQLVEIFHQEDEVNIRMHIENALKNSKQVGSAEEIVEYCLEHGDNTEEYPAIHGIDRFSGYWLLGRIKKAIINERSQELAEIEQKYGEDTVEAVVELLGLRDYKRLGSQITENTSDDIEQKSKERVDRIKNIYLQDWKGFYTQLFKERPDDFDPLDQIELMVNMFDYFDWQDEDKPIRNLYLEFIAKEIGWDYQHREGYAQITEAYRQALDFYTRAFFAKEWGKNPDPNTLNDAFDKAIHWTINCGRSLDSIHTFMGERIEEAVRTLYYAELKELSKKYGEDKTKELVRLISYREIDAVTAREGKDLDYTDFVIDSVFEHVKAELSQ